MGEMRRRDGAREGERGSHVCELAILRVVLASLDLTIYFLSTVHALDVCYM